jgi:hypothetical protein
MRQAPFGLMAIPYVTVHDNGEIKTEKEEIRKAANSRHDNQGCAQYNIDVDLKEITTILNPL